MERGNQKNKNKSRKKSRNITEQQTPTDVFHINGTNGVIKLTKCIHCLFINSRMAIVDDDKSKKEHKVKEQTKRKKKKEGIVLIQKERSANLSPILGTMVSHVDCTLSRGY